VARSPVGHEVLAIYPWLQGIRRDLHRHPELANEEHETQARLCDVLSSLGLHPRTFDGFTGILVDIVPEKARSRRRVALRSDMDGLPVSEATGAPFASAAPGKMHACGHDIHMTSLLGAARLWVEERVPLWGPARLLFQPAEEQGVDGGAKPFIARGALDRPKPAFVIGQHVDNMLPTGTIGLRPGPMMAASDSIDLYVHGHPGHAGYPQFGPDAVVVAAEIVVGLQALVSRAKSPVEPGVISIGSIHGGSKRNVLPETVHLSGTVRTFAPELRAQFAWEIPRRVRGLARSLGASVRVKYEHGYPAVVNDPKVTAAVADSVRAAWGAARVRDLVHPVMGAEDFSRYLERVPGTFWFLGVSPQKGSAGAKHTPTFLPDEQSLRFGTEALLLATSGLQTKGVAA
jgi:amidohydrolase